MLTSRKVSMMLAPLAHAFDKIVGSHDSGSPFQTLPMATIVADSRQPSKSSGSQKRLSGGHAGSGLSDISGFGQFGNEGAEGGVINKRLQAPHDIEMNR